MQYDGLMAKLEERREVLGWSKAEMARKLGVHWVTYHRLAEGKVPAGLDFYTRVLRAFPELGAEVQIAIRDRE